MTDQPAQVTSTTELAIAQQVLRGMDPHKLPPHVAVQWATAVALVRLAVNGQRG